MYKTVQNCELCGANLTLDDMRGTECPYCRTVFPHLAQAAQHAHVANQMMGQMMAQQAHLQNQWRNAFGLPTQQLVEQQLDHAQRSRRISTIVQLSTVGVLLLVGLIVALAVLL
jgi:hypothetical protein